MCTTHVLARSKPQCFLHFNNPSVSVTLAWRTANNKLRFAKKPIVLNCISSYFVLRVAQHVRFTHIHLIRPIRTCNIAYWMLQESIAGCLIDYSACVLKSCLTLRMYCKRGKKGQIGYQRNSIHLITDRIKFNFFKSFFFCFEFFSSCRLLLLFGSTSFTFCSSWWDDRRSG